MRDLTPAMAAALTKGVVRPFLFMQGEFKSSTVYYWTGYGTLTWNGHDWLGTGEMISAAPFDETNDVSAQGVAITLRGISQADVAEVLGEMQNFKPGAIWLGLLAEDGTIVGDPQPIFRGRLDTAGLDDSDVTKPAIVLGYENELIDLERPRLHQYTDQEQQARQPGDLGLQYVAGLQDQQVNWGNGGASSPPPAKSPSAFDGLFG